MKQVPFKAGKTLTDLDVAGITRYGFISTADLEFLPEGRDICIKNTCRKYGSTWACPPATGTVEECRQRLLSYANAMVFCGVYKLEDSFDIEGMQRGGEEFKNVCDRLYDLLEPPFLFLGTGGCSRCKPCTYPDAPCRHPERLFHSISGYSIFAAKMAASAGIPYIAGENTVSYFGLVCYN